MPVLDHTKILLIHIPRNGSLSIPWKLLNGTDEELESIHNVRDEITLSNGSKMRGKQFGKFETFLEMKSRLDVSLYTPITISRNPYTRLYSLYNHYLTLTTPSTKSIPVTPLTKQDKPFLNFLESIKYNKPYHPNARGLLHKTQSSFIYNESNQIDSSILIYKLENLNQLKLDLGVESMTHSNRRRYDDQTEIDSLPAESYVKNMQKKGMLYNLLEFQQAYTQQCIDLVQEIYAEDFDNFGYSINFLDCFN